ncbi:hypothetical protein B0H63DRAFT_489815 [Podospora didyma]|uniref:Uncharacterized protein n=1 Tax=Podospora didyma TaxID=330526 RepID=A0AAE0N2H3_9PEZI|nr:hypothetical protein B0H63DRAFT_489815 [Podospora didyma]
MPPTWATRHRQPLNSDDDIQLGRCLWPQLPETDFDPAQYRPLLDYLSSSILDLEMRSSLESTATKNAFAAVTKTKGLPKNEVEALVKTHYPVSPSDAATTQAMETIIRLWTMLHVQLNRPTHHSPANVVFWDGPQFLTEVIEQYFERKIQRKTPEVGVPTVDSTLTAARLVTSHRINIIWTSNLAEHLTLNGRTLKVFEHKIWAWNCLRYPKTSSLPPSVIEELINTWNLLFPALEDGTMSLLTQTKMVDSFYGLGYCGFDHTLEWDKYKYWRAEILELSKVLDEPQKGLQQFFRPDKKKRNALELALFWMAGVVVLFLTIVSSVCSVMSLKYSVEQTNLSRAQLDLALAATCADPEMATRLPNYCSK